VVGPGPVQARGAQQAADVVAAERRSLAHRHALFLPGRGIRWPDPATRSGAPGRVADLGQVAVGRVLLEGVRAGSGAVGHPTPASSRRSTLGWQTVTYVAADNRYESLRYRRCGRSGLLLPPLSLGLWHNFGGERPFETQRAIVRRAFDLGITHFDLANNYGPPYGSAEENFGRMLATDLAPYRDELVISTKAGYDMWPGPYGDLGSRKYLLASLDQSLGRMGLDYVDIFYSHRFDPDTPLEETMGALDAAVRAGKALYVGISSYNSHRTREAAEILRQLGTPLLIHQPSYSMLNRWIEHDHLLDTLEELGVGCIAFSPLAQGLLTNRYLDGVPADSRVATGGAMGADMLTDERLSRVRALNEVAGRRGQTLAELALVWALRDPRMTSLVIGASSVAQLEDNVAALTDTDLTDAELAEIDRYATDSDIDLWAESSAG